MKTSLRDGPYCLAGSFTSRKCMLCICSLCFWDTFEFFFHLWFPLSPQLPSRIPCKKRSKLTVAGELARLGPLLCIRHKTFFFLFLKCFISAVCVPVLVRVSPWNFAYKFAICVCVCASWLIFWSLPLTSQFDLFFLLLVILSLFFFFFNATQPTLVLVGKESSSMPCRNTALLPHAVAVSLNIW